MTRRGFLSRALAVSAGVLAWPVLKIIGHKPSDMELCFVDDTVSVVSRTECTLYIEKRSVAKLIKGESMVFKCCEPRKVWLRSSDGLVCDYWNTKIFKGRGARMTGLVDS